MDNETMILILVLIVIAVLISFLLIYWRASRYEKYFKEIQGLRNLNDRIRGLNEAMERINTSTMEEHLYELREGLSRVVDLLERRDHDHRVHSRDGVRSALESVLYAMGYQRVSVLGDMSEAVGANAVEIQVECVKNEMVHKGTVTMQAGSVVEVRIKPAYEVFP